MKRKLFVISILMALTLLVACSSSEKAVQKVMPDAAANEEQTAPADSDNTVKITSSGFEPKTLTVKAGTTVTFVNEDSNKHWPASAMHPTHAVYPESGGCIGSKFDACKGLAQGESFSFTFNEKGSWKYHDHLNVPSTGTIAVE